MHPRRSPFAQRLLACLLLGTLLTGSPALAAENAASEELFKLRELLIVDAEDGHLDEFTFLEGVLIASGVQQRAALDRYTSSYQQHQCEALAEAGELAANAQPAQLFDYLHERMLTGRYIAHRTELDQTLADGSFNCVTATVLYCQLCQAAGYKAHAVAAPGHVFAQLTLNDQATAVETTCPGWYSLLDDNQRQQALRKRRGEQPGEERVLTEVQLIAKVFYNRGVYHLERGSYADAIALIRLSLRLDPDDRSAQANLLAAFNNWALVECDGQRWEKAIRLIAAGQQIDPQYEALLANELHAHHGLATELCSQGRYAEAVSLLEAGYQRRPQAPLFNDGRFTIYRSWVESLLRQGEQAQAKQVISHVYRLDARQAERIWVSVGA